jgi:hypothetical protein
MNEYQRINTKRAHSPTTKDAKDWWHGATLLVYFDILYYIHSLHHIYTVGTFIHRHSLRFLFISSTLVSSMGKPFLWCAKPKKKLELWPVLQQADALPSELRRTLTELRAGAQTELNRALT